MMKTVIVAGTKAPKPVNEFQVRGAIAKIARHGWPPVLSEKAISAKLLRNSGLTAEDKRRAASEILNILEGKGKQGFVAENWDCFVGKVDGMIWGDMNIVAWLASATMWLGLIREAAKFIMEGAIGRQGIARAVAISASLLIVWISQRIGRWQEMLAVNEASDIYYAAANMATAPLVPQILGRLRAAYCACFLGLIAAAAGFMMNVPGIGFVPALVFAAQTGAAFCMEYFKINRLESLIEEVEKATNPILEGITKEINECVAGFCSSTKDAKTVSQARATS